MEDIEHQKELCAEVVEEVIKGKLAVVPSEPNCPFYRDLVLPLRIVDGPSRKTDTSEWEVVVLDDLERKFLVPLSELRLSK